MSESLAVVVLDWKRPQNMEQVIAGVQAQTVDLDLYIVHQENDRVYPEAENIHIQTNKGCGSRWDILPFVENEFTVFLDDDLELTDNKILETMLSHVEKVNHVSAVGITLGEDPDKPYFSGKKVYAPGSLTKVDVCMGNLNMVNTQLARNLWCTKSEFIRTFRRPGTIILGDDDIISSYLFNKAGHFNYAIGNDKIPYQILSTLHGLEHMPSHYEYRNELCMKLWNRQTVGM